MNGPVSAEEYCHWYEYAPGPPVAGAVSVRRAGFWPLQSTWLAAIVPGVSSAGCVMVMEAEAVHPFASVTDTDIAPDPALKNDCELNPAAGIVAPVVFTVTVKVYGS